MKFIRVLDKWLRIFTMIAAYISAIAVVVLAVATTADVLRRATTGKSVPGVIEGTEVVLVFTVFLGLALTQRELGHVSTSVVTNRLPPSIAAVVSAFGLAVVSLFCVWLAEASIVKSVYSTQAGEYRYGLLQVPIWPGRIAVAVGTTFLALEMIRRFLIEMAKAIRLIQSASTNQSKAIL